MVKLDEIAKRLNVSVSTVSRALSDHPRISKSTKKLVVSMAKQLNYVPNDLAASLRSGKGKVIGIIVPHINRQFFSSIIHGVETVLNANGYNLLICQSDESYDKEVEAIKSLLRSRVDGILISHSKETSTPDHLINILKKGIPLVQFDRVLSDIGTSCVVNNNESSAHTAVTHLLKEGYHHIAHLYGPLSSQIYKERLSGYKRALNEAGLNFSAHLVDEAISEETGYKVAKAMLAQNNPPDAFFCASDYSALGVIDYALEKNIRIPAELGIVGFANERFTSLMRPPISSVDQHGEDLGENAAYLLLDELTKKHTSNVPRILSIVPHLVIRASSTKNILPIRKLGNS